MKAFWNIARASCASALLLLAGCSGMGHSWFLGSRDREIESSTQAIQTARDDAHRAAAYAQRGTAYSEKARYSRLCKLIPIQEYDRLFRLPSMTMTRPSRSIPAAQPL